MRIVSLLPSATELLCAIPRGADMLVGRSHECDYPPSVLSLPPLTRSRLSHTLDAREIDASVRTSLAPSSSVQSLYTLNADLLAALRPDLILTQDLCHVCSIDLKGLRSLVSRLPDPKPQILSLNAESIEGVLDDLLRIGRAIGEERAAGEVAVSLMARMNHARERVNAYDDGQNIAFLEWTDPLFIGGHWTPQLIERAGARHPLNPTIPLADSGAATGTQAASRRGRASFAVTPDDLVRSQPERLIICPCGIPLDRMPGDEGLSVQRLVGSLAAQSWWNDLPAVRTGQVALVDGNQMFNRPGPRLVDALEWLVGWIQDRPELIPCDFPWRVWRDASARPA